jgi:hypothetical protein
VVRNVLRLGALLLVLALVGCQGAVGIRVSRLCPGCGETAAAYAAHPNLKHPLFQRKDLIYGSEIGSWQVDTNQYDGHPAYADTACRKLVQDAGISVVRWLTWDKFDYLGGDMPPQQFSRVIDGIIQLNAVPFIKLPPGIPEQCGGAPDVEWQRAIIREAGSRVVLYEFTNEANWMCDWDAAHYTAEWVRVVPGLKKYARSLGLEIYMGGPSWAWPNDEAMQTFIQGTHAAYTATGDSDVVPDFLSFHAYASNDLAHTNREIIEQASDYGQFVDKVRATARRVYGFDVPVAVTEWNYTVMGGDKRVTDREFMREFTRAMLQMFRDHNVWLANQYAIASHPVQDDIHDMISFDCEPQPMYHAFREFRARDKLAARR